MARRETAIATLIVGEKHTQLWRTYCRENWESYAARHGYDLLVFDQPFDDSPRARARSPAWQKLLLLGQPAAAGYEQVVWVDSDILMNPVAPAVAAGVPPELVGSVDEYSNPTPEIYQAALTTWYRVMEEHGDSFHRNETPLEFYQAFGFEDGFDRVVQSGVMVLSPRFHRDLLEHVYHSYEEAPGPHMLMEMRPLSYELVKAGRVQWLDPRFNLTWSFYKVVRFPFLLAYPEHPLAARCAAQAFAESYFLHFAGAHGEIAMVDSAARPPVVERSWVRAPVSAVLLAEPCRTPVALILFNRADTTERVLAAIRAARPRRLFVIADGPRHEVAEDGERCRAARAVLERVDWDCNVEWNIADTNLGLKRRVESGLDWLFERVEEAIILEDDVVPHPSFFPYCEELLARYRGDERVLTISGNDFRFGFGDTGTSYSFSRYPLIWGWATWRRAWRLNDPSMSAWPEALEQAWLHSVLEEPWAADYWGFVLQQCYERRDTWDYAWTFSSWRHRGLAIHPHVNLVSNIGFGSHATHTHNPLDVFGHLEVEGMELPLRHPAAVERDVEADRLVEINAFGGALRRLWGRLRAHQRVRRAGSR